MTLVGLQTVDFGESGPIRCSECKAYMCPHMQFMDRGRKFKCCFCNGITPTPEDYVCNTGVDGRRHDADDRPELCRGSVEFVASREYMVHTLPSNTPTYRLPSQHQIEFRLHNSYMV